MTTHGHEPNVHLTADEHKAIEKSFGEIRSVLARKNVHIENVLGLVTTPQLQETGHQVKVKFAEKNVSSMNMIAFD